jgi:hypothetical protein
MQRHAALKHRVMEKYVRRRHLLSTHSLTCMKAVTRLMLQDSKSIIKFIIIGTIGNYKKRLLSA